MADNEHDQKQDPPELLELRERWKKGHTKSCQCQSRGLGGPCRELRLKCFEMGIFEELYQ